MKISAGTADSAEAKRRWPGVLARWADMEAEWERRARVVDVTPAEAETMAARWAAWIAADLKRLDRAGEHSTLFADPDSPDAKLAASIEKDPLGRAARRQARLRAHAEEAAVLAGISVSEATMGTLKAAMMPVLEAAYRDAGLREAGVTAGVGRRWNPLEHVRRGVAARG